MFVYALFSWSYIYSQSIHHGQTEPRTINVGVSVFPWPLNGQVHWDRYFLILGCLYMTQSLLEICFHLCTTWWPNLCPVWQLWRELLFHKMPFLFSEEKLFFLQSILGHPGIETCIMAWRSILPVHSSSLRSQGKIFIYLSPYKWVLSTSLSVSVYLSFTFYSVSKLTGLCSNLYIKC